VATITHLYIQPRRTKLVRVIQVVGVALILVRGLIMQRTYDFSWRWKFDRRIAESPHWVMLKSCVAEIVGQKPMHMDTSAPKEYAADFVPLRQPTPAAPAHPISGKPKNVIVMVLESTGAQYMGVYGSEFDTTPRLSAEAAHSLIFDNFYAHDSLTALSIESIALSMYPEVSYWPDSQRHADISGTAVPKVLKPYGYRSAFMTSAGIEWSGQNIFLSHRGFDDIIDSKDLADPKTHKQIFSWGVEDRYLIDGMVKWIDQDRSKPFFMIGWNTQTHHPYSISPGDHEIDYFAHRPAPQHDMLNRYLNTLRCMDAQLGRLFDALRERGLDKDTVVIITGDHGEGFGAPHQTFSHGWHVYEENVHVSCIIWSPSLYPKGAHSPTLGGHVDLNPTIVDLLGIPPPDNCWQGRSLLGDTHPPRTYFFAALNDYVVGVREGNWKLIHNASLGEDQLYDLTADRQEQHNLASANPERCADLRSRLGAWVGYQGTYMTHQRDIGHWQ
jgi:arylsulfatase A-like enzyme